MNNVWATFEALKEISSLVAVKKIQVDEPKKVAKDAPAAPKTQTPNQKPLPKKEVATPKPASKKPLAKKPVKKAK
jgi:hypothetical protein